MPNKKVRSSALLFVLVMLFIVTLLTNIVLRIMLNQGRLSQHRIWRVQALYAAQAAMVLTAQELREGNWLYNRTACINCPVGAADYNVTDNDLKLYIVNITIHPIGDNPAFPSSAPIDITVNYGHSSSGVF